MTTLLRLSQCLATATEVKGFWNLVLRGLEENEYEAPFCLAYSADEEADDTTSHSSDNLSKVSYLSSFQPAFLTPRRAGFAKDRLRVPINLVLRSSALSKETSDVASQTSRFVYKRPNRHYSGEATGLIQSI